MPTSKICKSSLEWTVRCGYKTNMTLRSHQPIIFKEYILHDLAGYWEPAKAWYLHPRGVVIAGAMSGTQLINYW